MARFLLQPLFRPLSARPCRARLILCLVMVGRLQSFFFQSSLLARLQSYRDTGDWRCTARERPWGGSPQVPEVVSGAVRDRQPVVMRARLAKMTTKQRRNVNGVKQKPDAAHRARLGSTLCFSFRVFNTNRYAVLLRGPLPPPVLCRLTWSLNIGSSLLKIWVRGLLFSIRRQSESADHCQGSGIYSLYFILMMQDKWMNKQNFSDKLLFWKLAHYENQYGASQSEPVNCTFKINLEKCLKYRTWVLWNLEFIMP